MCIQNLELFRRFAKKRRVERKSLLFCLFSSLNREIPELEGKGHEPSRSKLKIVQLEPWLEPARLGLITTISLQKLYF